MTEDVKTSQYVPLAISECKLKMVLSLVSDYPGPLCTMFSMRHLLWALDGESATWVGGKPLLHYRAEICVKRHESGRSRPVFPLFMFPDCYLVDVKIEVVNLRP